MCRPRIQAVRKRVPDASGLTALTGATSVEAMLLGILEVIDEAGLRALLSEPVPEQQPSNET